MEIMVCADTIGIHIILAMQVLKQAFTIVFVQWYRYSHRILAQWLHIMQCKPAQRSRSAVFVQITFKTWSYFDSQCRGRCGRLIQLGLTFCNHTSKMDSSWFKRNRKAKKWASQCHNNTGHLYIQSMVRSLWFTLCDIGDKWKSH